jgi:hypothetical protein
LLVSHCIDKAIIDVESKADPAMPIRVVTPKQRISPARAEANHPIALRHAIPPETECAAQLGIAHVRTPKLKGIVQIGDLTDLNPTAGKVVDREFGGQKVVETHRLPRDALKARDDGAELIDAYDYKGPIRFVEHKREVA